MAVLPFLSTLLLVGGEPLAQNAAQCEGGVCVEDERVLIQKAAATASWDNADVGSTDDDKAESIDDKEEEEELVFSMSEEDFANAKVLIPQKLKAAGLNHELDVEGLVVYTSAGSVLQEEPRKADFPLKLKYERRRRPMPDRTNYTSTQLQYDMVTLAGNSYNFSKPAPECWKRELTGRVSTWFEWFDLDHFTLSTCQCDSCKIVGNPTAEVCAIAIAGSNDGNDWLNNINLLSNGMFCGRQDYHAGFAEEAGDVVHSPEWLPFQERAKKCGRLIFTGHSLGGAVASILARCVNCRHNCGRKPAGLRDLTMEAHLVTVGAPAVTINGPLRNDLAKDGTFKGTRFWNYMRNCVGIFGCQDPVPWVVAKVTKYPFYHPKVESVGLGMAGGIRAWNADNQDAILEPKSFMLPAFSEHAVKKYRGRISLHKENDNIIGLHKKK